MRHPVRSSGMSGMVSAMLGTVKPSGPGCAISWEVTLLILSRVVAGSETTASEAPDVVRGEEPCAVRQKDLDF